MHLYIHIPFCQKKCGYCAFASVSGGDLLFSPYCRALKKELEGLPQKKITTLFIGGGTPTALPQENLLDVLAFLRHRFGFADSAEISLEANPGTVDFSCLRSLLIAGVNRLSFGVQSFDDGELAALGRIHTAVEAKKAFNLARKAGFANISLDLIYGLPGQSPALWQNSLEQALALRPEHLSLYQLEAEEGTPLFTRIERELEQGEDILPSEEDIAVMDTINMQLITAAGYQQYEISNFARPGCQCRHNCIYWRNEEWAAAGAAAVSYIAGCRAKRVEDPKEYIAQITNGNSAIAEQEQLDNEAAFRETVIMGLRMNSGVTSSELKRRFGFGVEEYYGVTIAKLLAQNLLVKDGDAFFLSDKGRAVANQIMLQLV